MLVDNAAVGAAAPLLQSNVDLMEEMIKLNVVALMRLIYAAAPVFAARGHGAIINISSVAAIAPEMSNGVYCGAEGFVVTFSQTLHPQISAKGVAGHVRFPRATPAAFIPRGEMV